MKLYENANNGIQKELVENNFFQNMTENELYIGDYFLKGVCTEKRKF